MNDINPVSPDEITTNPGPNPDTGIGGNNPPEPIYDQTEYFELKAKVAAFLETSNKWKRAKITNETYAAALTDQISGLRGLFKRIEDARKKRKQPFIDGGKAVDADFNGLKDLVTASADSLKPVLQKWLDAEQVRLDAEQERKRAAAREDERIANLKAMEAQESGDIEAEVEAERLQKKAEKKAVSAAKSVAAVAKSASGAGRTISRRKRRHCTITNHRVLFMHFQDHPKVLEVLINLANAEANSKEFTDESAIPGVKIETKTTIA